MNNTNTHNSHAAASSAFSATSSSSSSSSSGAFPFAFFDNCQCEANLVIHVVQFLNAREAGRLMQSSKRFYYLVHQYRRLRGPELVAAASSSPQPSSSSSSSTNRSNNNDSTTTTSTNHANTVRLRAAAAAASERSTKQVYHEALNQLPGGSSPPNLVLSFNTLRRTNTLPSTVLPSLVPVNAVVLGAEAPAIQSNLGGLDQIESTSCSNLYLGSMPNAHIKPFCMETTSAAAVNSETRDFIAQLAREAPPGNRSHTDNNSNAVNNDDDNWWKVFMVYATYDANQEHVERFLNAVQRRYPRAVIVGGICSIGYVSLPTTTTTTATTTTETRTSAILTSKEELQGYTSTYLRTFSRSLQGLPEDDIPGGISKREVVVYVYNRLLQQQNRLRYHYQEQQQQPQHSYRIVGTNEYESGCIFGVALGGDQIPVRSVVSRGVKSLTTRSSSSPSDCLFVHQAEFVKPGDDGYMFQQRQAEDSDDDDDGDDDGHDDNDGGRQMPSYYLIRSMIDTSTGKVWSANEICRDKGYPDYIGLSLQRPEPSSRRDAVVGETFELHSVHPLSFNINAFVLFLTDLGEESSRTSTATATAAASSAHEETGSQQRPCAIQNAPIDLFDLSGEACIEDLDYTLGNLAKTVQKNKEEVLGAVMFSCGGRGPTANSLMRGHVMADATRFAKAFHTTRTPTHESDSAATDSITASQKKRRVPCLGFYAGGEIGPLALARRRRPCSDTVGYRSGARFNQNCLEAATLFQHGGVALQGFTVVFALFVVPVFDLSSFPDVDDSEANVQTFFAQRRLD